MILKQIEDEGFAKANQYVDEPSCSLLKQLFSGGYM
jgi:hypothetical protein